MAENVDRTMRLPDSEYFPEPKAKSGIAIHHTVCDHARRTLWLWRRDRTAQGKPKRVATAFVIDKDGTTFEAFDPACWAYQFGLPWRATDRNAFEKRFIGIEIASEGGLLEREGRLYAYGSVNPANEIPPGEALDAGAPYRGYRWFRRYQPAQLDALGRLVDQLCQRFDIPRVYPEKPFLFYGRTLRSFQGIIAATPWCDPTRATRRPIPGSGRRCATWLASSPPPSRPRRSPPKRPRFSAAERETLFTWNARQLNRMHLAAGSVVKTLLMELERRHVYLRLNPTSPGSHRAKYELVQRRRTAATRISRAATWPNCGSRGSR
jgi:hypothetical protein